VARAETLAEEQAEEMPRRKGARVAAPPAPEPSDEGSARPTLDELFGGEGDARPAPTNGDEEAAPAETSADPGNGEDSYLTPADDSDEIRDLAIASEGSGGAEVDGHEVTSPPSDADQNETERIVTEAVEAGASGHEIVAHEAGGGRNVPPLPPTEPFTTDESEGRDPEMQQP